MQKVNQILNMNPEELTKMLQGLPRAASEGEVELATVEDQDRAYRAPAPYKHPTKKDKEQTKKACKTAARSRKINRKK